MKKDETISVPMVKVAVTVNRIAYSSIVIMLEVPAIAIKEENFS